MLFDICKDCLEYCCEFLSITELLSFAQINKVCNIVARSVFDRWYKKYGNKIYKCHKLEFPDETKMIGDEIHEVFLSIWGDNIRNVVKSTSIWNTKSKQYITTCIVYGDKANLRCIGNDRFTNCGTILAKGRRCRHEWAETSVSYLVKLCCCGENIFFALRYCYDYYICFNNIKINMVVCTDKHTAIKMNTC